MEVQPADARRLAQRGVQLAASEPLNLFVLVFEAHRTTQSSAAIRRLLATALDRTAMCTVLLQGRAEPAEALLPAWISGYASAFVAPGAAGPSRPGVAAVPPAQRALTLRVDPSDPLARSIAERIAVDVREAGLTSDRAGAGRACAGSGSAIGSSEARGDEPGSRAHSRDDRARGRERSRWRPPHRPSRSAPLSMRCCGSSATVLETSVVVPVLRAPELYGLGERVEAWDGRAVSPTGAWNLASLWIKGRGGGVETRP